MMNAVKYQIEVDVGHTQSFGIFYSFSLQIGFRSFVSTCYSYLFLLPSANSSTATRDSAYG
jgi:hypothetical protein